MRGACHPQFRVELYGAGFVGLQTAPNSGEFGYRKPLADVAQATRFRPDVEFQSGWWNQPYHLQGGFGCNGLLI